MPAVAIETVRSFSPCLSFIFLLSARSSAALRSRAIDGGFRLAPFGFPLCPGLNQYCFGGRPGPILYSWPDASAPAGAASERSVLSSNIFVLVIRRQPTSRCAGPGLSQR